MKLSILILSLLLAVVSHPPSAASQTPDPIAAAEAEILELKDQIAADYKKVKEARDEYKSYQKGSWAKKAAYDNWKTAKKKLSAGKRKLKAVKARLRKARKKARAAAVPKS